MEAAVGSVGRVVGLGQFAGIDDNVPDADQAGQMAGRFELAAGQAGAAAGDGHCLCTQGQLGRLGDHGAIDAAGKRHGATAEAGDQLDERSGRIGHFGLHRSTEDKPARTKRGKFSTAMPWRAFFESPLPKKGDSLVPGCVIRPMMVRWT